MLLRALNRRDATTARLIGLALVTWSVVSANKPLAFHGRGLVVLLLLICVVASWLVWTVWSCQQTRMTADLYVLGVSSALLAVAAPSGAGSVGAFVAAMVTAVRVDTRHAFTVVGTSVIALGIGAVIYDWSALAVLAYGAGFSALALAGSNLRQMELRAEQAELLLAQTQRSHEEQLRATRLEEQTRIAREIHDVLAHSLAGLTIQLEATTALLDQGVDPELVRERISRAHELAREGLRETRRAVGALREDATVLPVLGIKALIDGYRTEVDATVELVLDGDESELAGPRGETVLRVIQEALTNVRKHAPGAGVVVFVHAGADGLRVVVEDRPVVGVGVAAATPLGSSGGGYGVRGMRERAQLLGGTLEAGPTEGGWQVELRLPAEQRPGPNAGECR